MDGHLLDQPLPSQFLDQIDPFLLIHHWDSVSEGGLRPQEVGVGPHPHRGFSPVTFIYKGNIQHRDSLGNNVIVEAGGTQWMHAGKGVTHSERPSKEFAESGGELEFIQFWVNTPAKHKMEAPYYLPISEADTPKIKEEGLEIAVVAGEYQGVTGPAKTYSPQTLLRVSGETGSNISIQLPAEYNTLIYQLNGELEINRMTIAPKYMVWFENEDAPINITVKENTQFIVLSGLPINEEVSSYGPFVMNNQVQIMEALRDANMGKMGVLIEEF